MSRKKLAAGNWKMNMLPSECGKFIKELAEKAKDASNDILVCPTAVCLPAAIEAAKGTNIMVGAQNMYFEEKGAFTGEISPNMLTGVGVTHVIIGHSERRQELYETSDDINLKIKNLLEKNITPILCVGETKQEKDNAKTTSKISKQIEIATKDLTQDEKSKIIVAYEPIWSIGTGLIPTIEEIDTTLSLIKELLPGVKTLYGGSANEENIEYLKKSELIDGYLLGGLSLKPAKLQIFINKAEN